MRRMRSRSRQCCCRRTRVRRKTVLLILTALQPAIFSVLANGGSIACSPPFSSRARGQQMHAQLLILEIFILAVLVRIFYRKPDDKPGCCLRESLEREAEIKQ